uniref:Uncharacterized protein n=1 Tax=Neogobius melanostomus TaxID=47308 RepID=A0A8C6SX57_9GOBI
MPGTLPTRLTTILSLLLPVKTLTALLIVMLSKLIPLTSTSLSPTRKPASSVRKIQHGSLEELLPSTGELMRMTLPIGEEDRIPRRRCSFFRRRLRVAVCDP